MSLETDILRFRSLHYGFADPESTICLWWAMIPDGRLHVRAELRLQHKTIEQLAAEIRQKTRHLKMEPIRYTVADEANIGKEDGDGETPAETFRKNGVSLLVIKPDPIQGWTRVRELFGLRPDGLPWLTINPSCERLQKALTSATQQKHDPTDIAPFANDQPLRALRVGAMSRPAPKYAAKAPLPKNAVGHLVEDLRNEARLARPS